ncbi:hypothetical protein JAAARDRAFT_240055 [Jaapia argillacea MUCL 33604]|uniref:Zn(2)-C6 fungal-type domain-containing protein n=1 Tax=Jaapia argillacea MUCL 33604 TaxID=933084 RepID=A0A067QFC5_9AGAM|nr:hypothetical protein JAAARDRAFT_240055 [Jaapia argillacea MUCL 33604]
MSQQWLPGDVVFATEDSAAVAPNRIHSQLPHPGTTVTIPPLRRKKASIACTECRRRQVKCEHPAPGTPCARCKKRGMKCKYVSNINRFSPPDPSPPRVEEFPRHGEPRVQDTVPVVVHDAYVARPQPTNQSGTSDWHGAARFDALASGTHRPRTPRFLWRPGKCIAHGILPLHAMEPAFCRLGLCLRCRE